MRFNAMYWLAARLGLAFAVVAAGCFLPAAGQGANLETSNPDRVIVELFAARDSGQIGVTLIPKDSKQANVLIENKTNKPLTVKLPEAFAGVPVLAQWGNQGGFGGGGGRGRGGGGGFGGGGFGGGQGFGGGMGGGGMGGMGGMGGGGMGGMGMGGMFNLAPEKVGKIKVTTVCLEHGKPDPSPRMAYELKPLESFTADPKVYELCSMLGRGKIDQRAAQAAAWHLADKMSWQQLAHKQIKHLNGRREPYFQQAEILRGMQIVQEAARRAERCRTESLGKSDSLSQK